MRSDGVDAFRASVRFGGMSIRVSQLGVTSELHVSRSFVGGEFELILVFFKTFNNVSTSIRGRIIMAPVTRSDERICPLMPIPVRLDVATRCHREEENFHPIFHPVPISQPKRNQKGISNPTYTQYKIAQRWLGYQSLS